LDALDPGASHEERPHNRAPLPLIYMAKNQTPEVPEGASEITAWCLRALLARHGVPKHKQWSIVAKTLELSRSQSNRKLTGKQPLTPPEVEQIARRFGETFLQVMEPALMAGTEPALLVVDSARLPCKVRLRPGEALPPFAARYVALGAPGQWVVVSSSGITMAAREVDLLLMQHQPSSPESI
jgi:BetR domain.